MKGDYKKIIKAVVPIVIALISIFVLGKIATSTAFHAKTIESLDDKKTTVMRTSTDLCKIK